MKKYFLPTLLTTILTSLSIGNAVGYEYQYGFYSEPTLHQAQLGYVDAQNTIADSYYAGNGVEKNYQKAFEWYQKAANNGHLEAMNSLALMYEKGDIGQPNIEQAEKWYKFAADRGHASSQYMVSLIYREHEKFQNLKLARDYLVRAANGGHAPAQYDLALHYEDALYDSPKSEKLALKYYQLAVAKRYPKAMNNLALMYEEGRGVEQNIEQALGLYNQSFQLGDAVAAYNLANLYYQGELVEKNYSKASIYYEFVLKNSDNRQLIADSLKDLIEMYEQGGYGLLKNPQKVKEYRNYKY